TNFITDLFDVVFGNGTFVAVGWGGLGNACLYASTNGITWPVSTNAAIDNFYRVIHGGSRFVAVGDGYLVGGGTTNRNIYTSLDGKTWTAQLSGAPLNDVHPLRDVACGSQPFGQRFVAVDDAHHLHTSVNGTSWTRTTNDLAGPHVSFCNGLFLIPVGPG